MLRVATLQVPVKKMSNVNKALKSRVSICVWHTILC